MRPPTYVILLYAIPSGFLCHVVPFWWIVVGLSSFFCPDNNKHVHALTWCHISIQKSLILNIPHHRRLLICLNDNNKPRHLQSCAISWLVMWFQVIMIEIAKNKNFVSVDLAKENHVHTYIVNIIASTTYLQSIVNRYGDCCWLNGVFLLFRSCVCGRQNEYTWAHRWYIATQKLLILNIPHHRRLLVYLNDDNKPRHLHSYTIFWHIKWYQVIMMKIAKNKNFVSIQLSKENPIQTYIVNIIASTTYLQSIVNICGVCCWLVVVLMMISSCVCGRRNEYKWVHPLRKG